MLRVKKPKQVKTYMHLAINLPKITWVHEGHSENPTAIRHCR